LQQTEYGLPNASTAFSINGTTITFYKDGTYNGLTLTEGYFPTTSYTIVIANGANITINGNIDVRGSGSGYGSSYPTLTITSTSGGTLNVTGDVSTTYNPNQWWQTDPTDINITGNVNINVGGTICPGGNGGCDSSGLNSTTTGTVTQGATLTLVDADVAVTGTYYYTGVAIVPTITVVKGSTTLVANTHYSVALADNIDAGTATVTITGIAPYSGTVTTTFTIHKATITIPDDDYYPTAIAGLTYNGSPQTLVNAPLYLPTGCSAVEYKLGTDGSDTGYGASIPSATDADTYTVWIKYIGDNNHEDLVNIPDLSGAITIARVIVSAVQTPTATAITYGAALSSSTLTGTFTVSPAGSPQPAGSFAWDDGTVIPPVQNPGYPVTFTPTDLINFDFSGVTLTQINTPITVSKAVPAYTAPTLAAGWQYDGDTKTLLASNGATSDGTITYDVDGGGYGAVATAKNAGTYSVSWMLTGDANHLDVSATLLGSVTITQKPMTITADNKSMSAGGTVPTLTWNTSDFVAGEDEDNALGWSWGISPPYLTTSATNTSSAGSYSITFLATPTATNYSISTQAGSMNVSGLLPLNITVTIDYTAPLRIDDGLTLTITGSYSGPLHYQWKSGATNVGTDAATYTVTASDVGKTISVTVTSEGETGSATATPTSVVQKKAYAGATPSAPTATSITTSSVTLASTAGYEYSKDGVNWQSSNVFSGLTGGNAYTFYQRKAATSDTEASPSSSGLNVTLPTQDQLDVAAAKAALEAATYTSNDLVAHTVTDARAAATAQVNTILSSYGVTASVTTSSFTAASAGADGTYTFTVALQKGSATATTDVLTMTITYQTFKVTVVVAAGGGGIVFGDGNYPAGAHVTVTAIPDVDNCYKFRQWDLPGGGNNPNATYSFTMPGNAVTLTAHFELDQDLLDLQDVNAVYALIISATYVTTQAEAGTGALAVGKIQAIIDAIAATHPGVSVSITPHTYILPSAGTESNPDGINGSYSFTVMVSKGSASRTTGMLSLTITTLLVNAETPEIITHPQSAVYAQNDAAAALTVTASVGDGGELSYQWYKNFGSAIVGATGSSYLPPTSETGTNFYYVTVTNTNASVNGSKTATISSYQATITVTVPTSTETPGIDNALRAYVRDGMLHVSGLSVGKTWSVYCFDGTLLYQNTASGSEASIAVSAHGMYLVKSGNETLKVVY
jgi:hypothetical protein